MWKTSWKTRPKTPAETDYRLNGKPKATRPKTLPPKINSKLMYKSSTPEEATVSLQVITPHGWTVETFERLAFSSNVRREPTAIDDCLLTAMTPRANPNAAPNATPNYLPYCDPSPSPMRPNSVFAMEQNSSLSNQAMCFFSHRSIASISMPFPITITTMY